MNNNQKIQYRAAQQSAEHHDKLIWTCLSIFIAAIILLLDIILKKLDLLKENHILAIALIILGIMIITFLLLFILGFRQLKHTGYKKCRDIENDIKNKKKTEEDFHNIIKENYKGIQFILVIIILIYIISLFAFILGGIIGLNLP